MTEVVKTEAAPAEAPAETVELSPIQAKAAEQGWRPKDQFEGDPDEFVDAPEFVRRGELFSKIEHQGKELRSVRQALEAFKQHHSKVAENEYKRALKSLNEERKQAFVDGDTDKAFAIEEQIEDAKSAAAQIRQEAMRPAVQELNPEFVAWTDANKWYTTDRAMKIYADTVGNDFAQQGMSPSDVLKKVAQEVRKEFAHKFTNPKASRPNAVEGASRAGSSVQRASVALDDTEREIMRKIVRSGVMTEAQYMADLKKVKGQ